MQAHTIRLLLVDEDGSHGDEIRAAYRALGEDVDLVGVPSLAGAREALAEGAYDLLIADLLLPDGNGLDLVTPPDAPGALPVVVMASHGDPQMAVEAIRAGAMDYVVASEAAFAGFPRTVERAIGEWARASEQARARRDLARSERRLRDAQKIAHLGFLTWVVGTDEMYWSEEAYRLFGYAQSEVQPSFERAIARVPDEERSWLQRRLETAAAEEREDEFDHRIVRTDGEIRHVHAHVYVARPDPVGPAHLVGTMLDITDRVRAEEAVRESEAYFRAMIENGDDIITVLDETGRVTYQSPSFGRLLGYDPESRIGRHALDLVHPEDRPAVEDRLRRLAKEPGTTLNVRYRLRHEDGTWRILESIGTSRPSARSVPGIVVSSRDITERVRAEESLRKLSLAVEQSPASVIITNAEGLIEYVNPRFVEVTGYALEEVVGRNPRLLKTDHTTEEQYRELWETITSGREWRGEFLNRKKNGELFWEDASISPITDADGRITHFIAVKEDVTVRKEYEERLLRQANYDDLTGLPNRLLASDRLKRVVARAVRERLTATVLFAGLDHFQRVNDTLGLEAGDRLLAEAGRRLQAVVRADDTVARFGGDEFILVVSDHGGVAAPRVVAEKAVEAFSEPFRLEGRDVVVTASVGVTVCPDDGDDPHVLLRNADAAMNRAKQDGGGAYRFFSPEMNETAMRRLEMESRLRSALARGELFLHYQPIMNAEAGAVVGAEALLRWRSPDLGLVPPDQFVPVAEESRLIGEIGGWVLGEACRQAAAWRVDTGRELTMAVNVSFRQFLGAPLVEIVTAALEDSGLAAGCLELEITEGLLMEDAPATSAILGELSDMGVRLAVDDFGTGYSALGYLKSFPVHILKIDRSFVSNVTTDPEDAALVTAIIAMADGLGLEVVGEGVETAEQLEFLVSRGCRLVQGFYFSHPTPPDEFRTLLTGD
ncbi:MAG: EAL domain-containing protein [Gemmatimonadota bacterium]